MDVSLLPPPSARSLPETPAATRFWDLLPESLHVCPRVTLKKTNGDFLYILLSIEPVFFILCDIFGNCATEVSEDLTRSF